jgi:hypothetical protein
MTCIPKASRKRKKRKRNTSSAGCPSHTYGNTKEAKQGKELTFSQDGKLGTDVTVADDTERLSSNLPAALGDLVPDALPHLPRSVR